MVAVAQPMHGAVLRGTGSAKICDFGTFGKIFALAVEEEQWKRLVELMGNPEWASEDLFKDRIARGQNQDALKALMGEWLSQWKVQDLYREAQKRRQDQWSGCSDARPG